MKLWISGEMDSNIGDYFRIARNHVENEINTILTSKDYGDGISSWDMIMVVSKDKANEYFNFDRKSKETDIRIVINYEKFENSNLLHKKQIIFDAIIFSVEKMTAFNITDFNFVDLKNDLLQTKKKFIIENAE